MLVSAYTPVQKLPNVPVAGSVLSPTKPAYSDQAYVRRRQTRLTLNIPYDQKHPALDNINKQEADLPHTGSKPRDRKPAFRYAYRELGRG